MLYKFSYVHLKTSCQVVPNKLNRRGICLARFIHRRYLQLSLKEQLLKPIYGIQIFDIENFLNF